MRETSTLYRTLRAATGSLYEVNVVRGQTVYGMSQITSLTIHQSLLGDKPGPAVGGVVSARCAVTLQESSANWPRMASFEVKVRLCSEDGLQVSEWLSLGTFLTDQRSENKYGDLSIQAYDGMLMLDQYWTDRIPSGSMPASWPITAAAAASLLAQATGVQLDSRDVLDDTVAFIGLDTLRTAREVWADIAAAEGCNAILTPENKIHLIPLTNISNEDRGAIAGVAIAGLAIVGVSDPSSVPGPGIENLGLKVNRLETSPALPAITGVILTDPAGYDASAGASTGYVMRSSCDYSDSGAAALCLSNVKDYVYRPFAARDAHLDPAVELGDLIIFEEDRHQIMSIDWSIGAWITADIAAASELEVDHEYTTMTRNATTLRKAMQLDAALNTQLRSYVQQTAEQIMLGVAATYVSDTNFDATVARLQSEIDGAIETFSGSEVPTLQNPPASTWTSDAERDTHVGDLYMVNSQGGDYAGFYYRFEKLGPGSYQWTLLKDSEVTKALAEAEEANERAQVAIEDAAVLQSILENDYSPTAQIEADFYSKEEGEETAAALQSEITLTENRLTLAMSELRADVNGEFEAMAYYIRYKDGVIIIGRTDMPLNFRISPTQISACDNDVATSYWNADKQVTPKVLEIPVGGSLRTGSVQWQPRSSGNLSLLWVGSQAQQS